MKIKMRFEIGVIFFVCCTIPNNAFAYLDPGTGSYILQVTVALLIGGLYAIKLYWIKVKAFFNKIISGGSKTDGNA